MTSQPGIHNPRYSHGHRIGTVSSPTYHSWLGMIQRCTNPTRNSWPNYGGRGVKICERWLHSFENFLSDMGERPEGKTLDRFPNNDGNYEPGNCRWATRKEQANNQRPPSRPSKVPHDLSGQRFNRLVALQLVGRSKDRHAVWRCVCDCGTEIRTMATSLRTGNTQSCGCLSRQRASENMRRSQKLRRYTSKSVQP